MTTQLRNIGALISVLRASANAAATAGGSGDATEVVGATLDRGAIGFPQSCVLAIPFSAVLAEDETLSIACDIEAGNESDLSDATAVKTATSAVVATGPTGGGTVTGTLEVDASIMGAGRYIRANFTPYLSAADTDTAALSSVMVFGGADRLPQ